MSDSGSDRDANTNTNTIDFDKDSSNLSLAHIGVRFQSRNYLLVEALGDAVAQWRNAQLAGTTLRQSDGSDTKTIALGGMADGEPLLVSLCLFHPGKNGELVLDGRGNVDTRQRVPLSVVRGWPHRVVNCLFERVKKMSGLDQTETVDSLEKSIASSRKRLERLKESGVDTEEEASAKN